MKVLEDYPAAIFRVRVQSRNGQVERQGDMDGQSDARESFSVPIEQ
jgi:hypothetical protein